MLEYVKICTFKEEEMINIYVMVSDNFEVQGQRVVAILRKQIDRQGKKFLSVQIVKSPIRLASPDLSLVIEASETQTSWDELSVIRCAIEDMLKIMASSMKNEFDFCITFRGQVSQTKHFNFD